MVFKFTINPVLYFILIFLEMYGMYFIVSKLTGLKVKLERVIKLTLILTIVIFLTDIFVFQFHKSGLRAMTVLVFTFFYYKSLGKLSILKALICVLIFLGIALGIDVFMQFIMQMVLVNIGMNWSFDNFAYTYIFYVTVIYAVGWIVSLRSTSLIKLDKISM